MTNPTDSLWNRRQALQALGLGGLAMTVAACSSKGASPVTGAAEVKELNFYNWSMAEAAPKPVWEKMLAAYQTKTGIKIKPVTYPFTGFLEPMLLAARNGQAFGTFQIGIDVVKSFSSLGVLEDLSDIAAKHDYVPATLLNGQIDGKQYALPQYSGAIGTFVNQKWLDRVGVKPGEEPETIADFEKLLLELKKIKGVIPWVASTKDPALKDIIPWMWTFGSPIFENGKVTVGDDASVEALEWYKSILDRGLCIPDVSRTESRVIFGRGDGAYYEDATLARSYLTAAPHGAETVKTIRPVARAVLKAGDKPRALTHGHAIAVLKGKGSTTARALAEYLTSDPEALKTFFEGTSLPTPTKTSLEASYFANDQYQKDFAAKVTDSATPDPFWAFSNFAQIEKILTDSVAEVLAGRKKAKPALTDAAKQMQSIIKL
ncbi:ABC transporter substrate-binding protein [Actinomadura scrupuli]|uniref:ABC transporter substrate-binding protein n=1 Tax=Actinomadura scrupuli TaxID=559629 RepID=UPI003D9533C2